MPDLSGDEVLTRIREDADDSKVGKPTAVDPDLEILSVDVDDYLTKPIR
jgi:DNA-binding response OmpR family regulator